MDEKRNYCTGHVLLGVEYVCPVCGTHYWRGIDWAYKISERLSVCSYHCLIKYEKQKKAKDNWANRRRCFFKNTETGETVTVTQLADRYGKSRQSMDMAWRKGGYGIWIAVKYDAENT